MTTVLTAYRSDYLRLRRIMGHVLANHENLISSFLTYLDGTSQQAITVETAVAWASLPAAARPRWRAYRLAVIRGFAAYVHAQDPALAQMIPDGLIPSGVTHGQPYIYSDGQIHALMDAAQALQPRLRGLTLTTVIGLMAATGMRISECLGLDTAEVDLDSDVLTVTGKRNNQRLVPIHPSTTTALAGYLRTSRKLTGSNNPDAFFLNFLGARPHPNGLQRAFRALAISLGYGARPGGKPPRLHDLRHTFATNALVQAHRQGADVDARIAALATYLGHVSPASTYWYLDATPELLALAADKVDAAQSQGGLLS